MNSQAKANMRTRGCTCILPVYHALWKSVSSALATLWSSHTSWQMNVKAQPLITNSVASLLKASDISLCPSPFHTAGSKLDLDSLSLHTQINTHAHTHIYCPSNCTAVGVSTGGAHVCAHVTAAHMLCPRFSLHPQKLFLHIPDISPQPEKCDCASKSVYTATVS